MSDARSRRLKHVADVAVSSVDKKSTEGEIPVRLCNYVDVYNNERITEQIDFMEATAPVEQIVRFSLRPGDVLLTKDSETPEDIAVTAVVDGPLRNVVCGYHLALIRPRKDAVLGPYLRWALASSPARAQLTARASGITRFGLRWSAINDVTIPVPALSNQQQIADYLDRETARLDELVEKKQRLKALIEEYRRVAVERVVLSDNQPMTPFRRFVTEIDERSAHGVGTLLSVSLHLGVVPRDEMTEREGRADDTVGYKLCRKGDLILNRMRAFQGAVGMTDVDGLVSPDYSVLRPNPSCACPEYMHHLLRTPWFIGRLSSIVRGIGSTDLGAVRTPRVNIGDLLRLRVPDWPCVEQERRARRAEQVLSRADAYHSRITRSIALLVEKRQALITRAISGQINVIEAA